MDNWPNYFKNWMREKNDQRRLIAIGSVLLIVFLGMQCGNMPTPTPLPHFAAPENKPDTQANPPGSPSEPKKSPAAPENKKDNPGEPAHVDVIPPIEGTLVMPISFQNEDCACGNYKILQSSGSKQFLSCSYGVNGSGQNTRLQLAIQQQTTVELLNSVLMQDLPQLHARVDTADKQGSVKNRTVNTLHDNASGFSYVITYSLNSGSQETWCGDGQGAVLVNDSATLNTTLESCEIAKAGTGYTDIMEQLEMCGREVIARRSKK